MGRTRKNIETQFTSSNDVQDFNSQNIKCTSLNDTFDVELNLCEQNVIDIINLKKKEKMLYDVLNDFFKKCPMNEIDKIIDIIKGKYKISLRFLDWFVTRYCYLYKTSIPINNQFNIEHDFNINISYKAQLKSFKKKCFDPFKRKNKFYYSFGLTNDKININNYKILTTLGQLNFFKWALSFDIIKYVENNFDVINSKITHVNSFFKKNIIDTNTLSIVSSDDFKSKMSIHFDDNDNDNNNHDHNSDVKLNINIDAKNSSNKSNTVNINSTKLKKKVSMSYPVISRNIFVEL